MTIFEIEQLLQRAGRDNPQPSITLPELPGNANDLLKILNQAVCAGRRTGASLVKIQAPMDSYFDVSAAFGHATIQHAPDQQMICLTFSRCAPLSSAA